MVQLTHILQIPDTSNTTHFSYFSTNEHEVISLYHSYNLFIPFLIQDFQKITFIIIAGNENTDLRPIPYILDGKISG